MQNYHLHLKGFVGGYDFDKNYVDYVLGKNAGKPVFVLIDSLGGSLATALSIASSFRNHGDVTVHFVGMNASAATIASLGAKHITMDASAMYLAHKCSTEFFQWAQLNADQLADQIASLEQLKTDLEKMDANVAGMYSRKCKKDADALLALMKVGGWLSAKEALDWGFVDEITNADEDKAPVLTDAVASAMASVGMPIPNLPVESNSQFSKFLNAIANLFRSQDKQPQNISEPMNKLFPLLAAALAIDALQFTDGKCSLTEAQCDTLEAFLKDQADKLQATITEKDNLIAQRDQSIKDLQAKVDEQSALLAAKPGDKTSQVLNNGNAPTPANDIEEQVRVMNDAKALFDMLP
ncbi:MAG: Clp protease ClpP [Paludibacteraceae bacterium]|jgi:ATP-dependent protease ClpP protease subunit|nr:Clp protease ClpP [Paludibacteraceae bacterium]MBQ7439776.1 Clp protease ClpP [Paludibacteraceae bacterium]MBQ8705636.1 Clp protease ClpP [Paludibacteraceae bacterium]